MERHCYPGSVSLVGFSSPRLKTPSFPKSLKKRSFGIVRASAAVETKVAIIRIGTRGRYLFFLSSFFFFSLSLFAIMGFLCNVSLDLTQSFESSILLMFNSFL